MTSQSSGALDSKATTRCSDETEDVLNEDGSPVHLRGVANAAHGLFFVGLRHQHTVASHDIYGVAKDAEFVADRIRDRLVRLGNTTADDHGVASHVSSKADRGLRLVPAKCCVCDTHHADLIGSGLDYEYATSPEVFHAYQCSSCQTVYLNPRPDVSEFARIYPDNYHTLEFSEANY